MTIPKILIKKAKELEEKVSRVYPKLAPLASQCFLNTIETTVQRLDDGTVFVITGDIPAMWLRDSAAQVRPYVKYAKDDADLKEILKSIIARHVKYICIDPYANAYNAEPNANGSGRDQSVPMCDWIWERKYEVDSLCASLYLAYEYYHIIGDLSVFTEEFRQMIKTILKVFILEQHHMENSDYFFDRRDGDTLACDGHGSPVAYTGMTWSACRPSDDPCFYGYLIPSNMMAVVALRKASEMLLEGYNDNTLSDTCLKLAGEIDSGIQKYGIYDHPKYGKIYAYEVDGLGGFNLMDDANSPSLLSIPYIGYTDINDPVYQNTRKFILSTDNPYYYTGRSAKGIGSPHTRKRYIWHIALIMQILTGTSEEEKESCLAMLAATHNNTNFMHESFFADDPAEFSRPWFAWANTLFAEMLELYCANK